MSGSVRSLHIYQDENYLPHPIANASERFSKGLPSMCPSSECYAVLRLEEKLGRRSSYFYRIGNGGKKHTYIIRLGYSIESSGGITAEGYYVTDCPGYLPDVGVYSCEDCTLFDTFEDANKVYDFRVQKMQLQGWILENQQSTDGWQFETEKAK